MTISSVIFALPLCAADGAAMVDRGLPKANLSNTSGTAGWHDHGFPGDDFTIGATGERKSMWYNQASNAALSGSRQDGADGAMLLFDAAGRSEDAFRAEDNGWDKSADIHVQVFAHRVSGRTAAPRSDP